MSQLLELIGNTPLVELSRLNPNPKVKIFGKLEGNNPGGSVKDRAAKSMIEGAIARGELGTVILGRDHHDVSGTDSPYRETSNIYDGSRFTADMAVHNAIGDSFRGATWVSLHNGGGVGWGEVINGGFGLVLDGTEESDRKLETMLFFDVNNGIARRAWARNPEALIAIGRELVRTPRLKVTVPQIADESLVRKALNSVTSPS